jgi:hypothetical protein
MSDVAQNSVLLNFLFLAEKRPLMYFSSLEANDVHSFLAGWRTHQHFFEDNDVFADRFFSDFHAFVQLKYTRTGSIGWQSLIKEKAKAGESEFELFMSILREFEASGEWV